VIQNSISPLGEKYSLPQRKDYEIELKRISDLVKKAKKEKKEIVVVMGLDLSGL